MGYTATAMDGHYHLGQRVKITYDLDLDTCELRRAGVSVPVSDRDFAIIAALAIHGKPVPPAQLGAMVLPGIEERVAVNALKVSIHRLRIRTRDSEIIRYSYQSGGYLFGSTMRINHPAEPQPKP